MSEEECFFLLCAIVEDILPEYFSKSMIGSLVDVQVFDSLLKKHQPIIYDLVTSSGSVSCVAVPWFMCMFVGHLPWNETLRAIDMVLTEGPRALFVISLAMIHASKENIQQGTETLQFFRDELKDTLDSKKMEGYIPYYYSIISDEEIEELRNLHRPQVTKEIQCYGGEVSLASTDDETDSGLEMTEFEQFQARMKENQEALDTVKRRTELFNQRIDALEHSTKLLTMRGRQRKGILTKPNLPSFRGIISAERESDIEQSSIPHSQYVEAMKEFINHDS